MAAKQENMQKESQQPAPAKLEITPIPLARTKLVLDILNSCDGIQGDKDDFVLHEGLYKDHMFINSSGKPYTLNDLTVAQVAVENELPVILVGPKETMAHLTTRTRLCEEGLPLYAVNFPLPKGGEGYFEWHEGGKHNLKSLGDWYLWPLDPEPGYSISSGPVTPWIRYRTDHFIEGYDSYRPQIGEQTNFAILGVRCAFTMSMMVPTGRYKEERLVQRTDNYIIVDLPKE